MDDQGTWEIEVREEWSPELPQIAQLINSVLMETTPRVSIQVPHIPYHKIWKFRETEESEYTIDQGKSYHDPPWCCSPKYLPLIIVLEDNDAVISFFLTFIQSEITIIWQEIQTCK